jgi:non-ribosomal peptide synthetase component F
LVNSRFTLAAATRPPGNCLPAVCDRRHNGATLRNAGRGQHRERSPDGGCDVNIANLFLRASRRRADDPAVALGQDVLLSHGALMRRAAAIAGALRSRHRLAPGDRVALVMSNVPDYLELLLAGWYAGLTMVPA